MIVVLCLRFELLGGVHGGIDWPSKSLLRSS
jgi:hypothetical protein